MSAIKPFFDTNVLLYLLAEDDRADIAESLLGQGGTISVQVLNEFASVASRKLRMGWPEIREILATIQSICSIVPVGVEIHDDALDLCERYGFSFYDAAILAAAIQARCDVVYSEDMQDGQTIGNVIIKNPFRR